MESVPEGSRTAEDRVEIAEPGKMHLVGHFLRAVLAGRIEAGARVPRGRIGIRAGSMEMTLTGDGRCVRLDTGIAPDVKAVVSAPLDTLMGIALGRGMVHALLARRIRIRGNPFALLSWMPVLSARSGAME